jgi:DNA-binding NarL/FixJ family response regulator
LIVAATTTDLMDRSRISAAIPDVVFGVDTAADVVIVDLARGAQQVTEARSVVPAARIVCYGPHVDDEAASAALAAGADVVMARARFFRDPAAAIVRDAD